MNERTKLISFGLAEGLLTAKEAENFDIHMLRELMSENGIECLKKGYFTLDDAKELKLSIIRELLSHRGFQALSEGLFTIEHIKQLGLNQIREILSPAIMNRLQDNKININDLIELDFVALGKLASIPDKLPPNFQTSLEKYHQEHHTSTHPMRILLGFDDALTANGLINLDVLCSIDEQEQAIRSNTNRQGYIGTLHLGSLQAESNLDYLFTLGGLALLERYNSSSPQEQAAIIRALNDYHRDPKVCADKAIEGFYDYLDKALQQVRGISRADAISFDEIVQHEVLGFLSSKDGADNLIPERRAEIKKGIKKKLKSKVGGMPEFEKVDDFIDYAIEHHTSSLTPEQTKKLFFEKYNELTSVTKSIFNFFKSHLKSNTSLEDIFSAANKGKDQNAIKALRLLGWMDLENKITDNAPACLKSFESMQGRLTK